MFIIERRTAGVLAALATTAAVAVLGNVWDRVDEVATPSTANSTAAFATSVGSDVRHDPFLAAEQPAGCAPVSGTEPQAAPRQAVWPCTTTRGTKR
jgi:hypothetical protein